MEFALFYTPLDQIIYIFRKSDSRPSLSDSVRYIQTPYLIGTCADKYRSQPNYRTMCLDFSKLLNKLVVKYQPNKGTL